MNIIVVFPKKEAAQKIRNVLVKNGYDVSAVCTTGARAIEAAGHLESGVIICGVRFVDMLYCELKDCLPVYFEMIVIARREMWQEYGGDDTAYLPLPMSGFDLLDQVDGKFRDIERRMKKDLTGPKARTEEEKDMIRQAKELLMYKNGYSEEEAHRFLQKQSMDGGHTLVETAGMVLDMF